jgi:DNA-binding XRE family transcriptional regulator
MTGDKFKSAIVDLGYTNASFARLVGVSTTTIWNWTTGAAKVPGAVVVLIDVLQSLDDLQKSVGDLHETVGARCRPGQEMLKRPRKGGRKVI